MWQAFWPSEAQLGLPFQEFVGIVDIFSAQVAMAEASTDKVYSTCCMS